MLLSKSVRWQLQKSNTKAQPRLQWRKRPNESNHRLNGKRLERSEWKSRVSNGSV